MMDYLLFPKAIRWISGIGKNNDSMGWCLWAFLVLANPDVRKWQCW